MEEEDIPRYYSQITRSS